MAQKDGTTEVIDGVKYTVYMLPPKTARTMLIEMVKVLGPALSPLLKGGVQGVMNADLGGVLQSLSENLHPETLDDHMSKLAAFSHADGVPLTGIFDIHFQGELGRMFKWYFFAIKVNFGTFTSALESVSKSLPMQTKAESQSPTT